MGSQAALRKGSHELYLYCGCQPAAPSGIRSRKCQTLQKSSPGDSPTSDLSLPCWVDCLYLRKDEAPMNIQLPAHMDKPSFLAWLQGREGRFELVDGRVVMMVNATRAHGMIVSNLVVLLRNQLDPKIWTVITDFGLDAGPKTLRFPDVVVDRAGGKPTDYTAIAPSLLIEVLSPS